jgi:hypothetical protein
LTTGQTADPNQANQNHNKCSGHFRDTSGHTADLTISDYITCIILKQKNSFKIIDNIFEFMYMIALKSKEIRLIVLRPLARFVNYGRI